ncbi:MAG: right-handed parallel beta-helix repeat-containing protein [Methanophagales archaeon]|nr:right-handed parallel beta-helix repeat-containing protein [Methanophagales archaeon]
MKKKVKKSKVKAITKSMIGLAIVTIMVVSLLGVVVPVGTASKGPSLDIIKDDPTIIVAASDSTIFDKEQADFVADGIDDQVTIQAAIDALPACGGKVFLMSGTFNISATIYLRSNMIIEGEGPTSIIRLKDGIITVPGKDGLLKLIHSPGTSTYSINNIHIRNFTIDGNYRGQVSGAWPVPIRLHGTNYFTVSDMYLFDAYSPLESRYSSHGIIYNNFIRDVIIGDGIGTDFSSFITITGNILENAHEGIDLDSNTTHSIVSNNILRATTRQIAGIMVTNSSYNVIINNQIKGHPILYHTVPPFATGVWLRKRTADDINTHNIVKGNNIRHMWKGIRIHGTNALIQENIIEYINRRGIDVAFVISRIPPRFVMPPQNVTISQNQFRNIGEHGISIASGTKDITVQENQFNNVGIVAPNIFNEIHVGFLVSRLHVNNNTINTEKPVEPANILDVWIRRFQTIFGDFLVSTSFINSAVAVVFLGLANATFTPSSSRPG